jgi:Fe-S-cluster-containing dehydrogenase component
VDKWNLVIDVALCENCNNCVLAAKDELVGNRFPGYSAPHAAQGQGVMRIERHIRGSGHLTDAAHRPVMCNHCDEAPCVKAGGGAVVKRADGIVIIDPDKARGRRDLVASCPYGAIVWNEVEQLPQTWFFDAHLLDQGAKAPRCVSVCPTQAIEAIKLDDAAMAQRAAREDLQPLRPELGTRPRVYYRQWQRFSRVFVAGSILARDRSQVDCLAGATLELLQDGTSREAISDAFGDFKLDGIEPDSGTAQLRVTHTGYAPICRELSIGHESVCLGEIVLEPLERSVG